MMNMWRYCEDKPCKLLAAFSKGQFKECISISMDKNNRFEFFDFNRLQVCKYLQQLIQIQQGKNSQNKTMLKVVQLLQIPFEKWLKLSSVQGKLTLQDISFQNRQVFEKIFKEYQKQVLMKINNQTALIDPLNPQKMKPNDIKTCLLQINKLLIPEPSFAKEANLPNNSIQLDKLLQQVLKNAKKYQQNDLNMKDKINKLQHELQNLKIHHLENDMNDNKSQSSCSMILLNNNDYILKIQKLESQKICLIKQNSAITTKLENAKEIVEEKKKEIQNLKTQFKLEKQTFLHKLQGYGTRIKIIQEKETQKKSMKQSQQLTPRNMSSQKLNTSITSSQQDESEQSKVMLKNLPSILSKISVNEITSLQKKNEELRQQNNELRQLLIMTQKQNQCQMIKMKETFKEREIQLLKKLEIKVKETQQIMMELQIQKKQRMKMQYLKIQIRDCELKMKDATSDYENKIKDAELKINNQLKQIQALKLESQKQRGQNQQMKIKIQKLMMEIQCLKDKIENCQMQKTMLECKHKFYQKRNFQLIIYIQRMEMVNKQMKMDIDKLHQQLASSRRQNNEAKQKLTLNENHISLNKEAMKKTIEQMKIAHSILSERLKSEEQFEDVSSKTDINTPEKDTKNK